MSNLLEEAIVDATALKEVAMKNAEAALIEKYSKEFKNSIEKLLEQDEAAGGAEGATDPAAPAAPPIAPMGGAGADPEKEKAFKKVKSSFLEGNDEELVTIDFDELKKQLTGPMGGAQTAPLMSAPSAPSTPEAAPAAPAGLSENLEEMSYEESDLEHPEKADLNKDDEISDYEDARGEAIEDSMESEEEMEEMYDQGANSSFKTDALDEEENVDLNEIELEEEMEEDALIDPKHAKQMHKHKKHVPPSPQEENLQVSPEELKELAEMLTVDIDVENLSDGHMGSIARDKREQRNLEFAAARDEKEEEKRAEEQEAMSDLKSKLSEAIELGSLLVDENEDLKEKLAEMYGHLENLKENVEKLSISNAKLLYTNKVLGNSSLNERQKEQIVESISRSTSVLEAKTIYNTLQSTVSGVNSEKKPRESLSEAINRGNSPFLVRKQQATELSFADRMKKLAGIQNKS